MMCFCVNPIFLCMVSTVFLFAKFDFIDVLTPPSQWEVKLSFLNLCMSCLWLQTTDQHSANILIAVIWDCYICLVMCHMGQAIVRLCAGILFVQNSDYTENPLPMLLHGSLSTDHRGEATEGFRLSSWAGYWKVVWPPFWKIILWLSMKVIPPLL